MKKTRQLLMLLTCIAVMCVAAIQKNGKLIGYEVCGEAEDNVEAVADSVTTDSIQTDYVAADSVVEDSVPVEVETLKTLDDGTIVVNTTELCKDVNGYEGPVPVEISINDGVVSEVKLLANNETPGFIDEAAVIVANWKDKKVEEALNLEVDAVSGATFSSKAIITNTREGLKYAIENMPGEGAKDALAAYSGEGMDMSLKSIIGLIVVLMGAIIPLFFKNKTMRTVQLILNVVILGLWCGTFLNYTLFLGALSNGMNVWTSLIPIVMLITAFIYPLFGKKSHYCTHICPFGSLQDLAGKCSKKKVAIPHSTLRILNWFRQGLWIVLMALMVLGLWFDWINYEFFTAFIFQAASWVVIALAIICTITSIFVPRPYCRFVCPTGTLMKAAEDRF